MGTTTSPRQQNPQTGADKDPCEVYLALKARLFINTKIAVFLCLRHESFNCEIFTTHVCEANCY